jgi:hypothetical protein
MAKITDIHIQDKVRFLDSVGEGIVVKIDTKQKRTQYECVLCFTSVLQQPKIVPFSFET